VREGFVIGHFDRGKIPLWMSMRWTKADLVASLEAKERRRQFDADDELPKEARGSTDYETSGLDRGHLARNKDNLAWGEDNARMGDLMSNVVPQPAILNRGPWLELEKVISSAPERKLALSDTFWIVAGPIFEAGEVKQTTGNGIAVPDSFFKIVTWIDRHRKFQAMAFIFPKDATNKNPTVYLSSVNEVEARTGIDFFPELETSVEQDTEAFIPKRMWEMSR
jgi:endonuclease G